MVTTPWIRGSNADVLLRCPRRWWLESGPKPKQDDGRGAGREPGPPSSPEARLGLAVHDAVENWIHADDWKATDPSAGFQSLLDNALVARSVAATGHRAKMVKLTMRRRIPELAQWIRAFGADVAARPEVDLADEERRLKGRADVVITSGSGSGVCDVKTGLPDSAALEAQLSVYAVLLKTEGRGSLAAAAAFTPSDGLLVLPLDMARAESVVDELLDTRSHIDPDHPMAMPTPATCRYCTVRGSCQPHWQAVADGLVEDAARGTVELVEVAANGLTALRLETDSGQRIVVAELRLEPSAIQVGAEVAVFGLAQPRGETDQSTPHKRATRAARLEVLSQQ